MEVSAMGTSRRIFNLVKPYRRQMALGLMLQFIVILSRLASPYVTQAVVNDVIEARHLEWLMP